jgi:transketolase
LLRIADADPKVIAIGVDTTKSVGMGPMAQKYPDRVFNIGIAEQNMMAIAAGLAATGMQVYAASYAPSIIFDFLLISHSFLDFHI